MGAYIKKFLERKERRANRIFTISTSGCYFCKSPEIIRFKEHWRFCPDCAAIYTWMVLLKIGCGHINAATPVVVSDCWYTKDRRAKTFIKENNRGQVCSTCGESCEADGW